MLSLKKEKVKTTKIFWNKEKVDGFQKLWLGMGEINKGGQSVQTFSYKNKFGGCDSCMVTIVTWMIIFESSYESRT